MPNKHKYLGAKSVIIMGVALVAGLLFLALSSTPPKSAFGGGGGGGFVVNAAAVSMPPSRPIAGLFHDICCLLGGDAIGAISCFNDQGFGGGGGGGFMIRNRAPRPAPKHVTMNARPGFNLESVG